MTVSGGLSACLKVGVMTYYPFMFLTRIKKPVQLTGTMIEFNAIIGAKMNMCIQYIVPKTEASWESIIELLDRGADYIGVPTLVNDRRRAFLEYGVPFNMEKIIIIYKRPVYEANVAGFVNPYTITVWVLILVASVVLGVVLYYIDSTYNVLQSRCRSQQVTGQRIRGGADVMWPPCVWTVSALVAQSSPWWPRGSSPRVLAGVWLLVAFIVGTVYRNNLTALIIIPKLNLPFNSMSELMQTNIPTFIPNGTFMYDNVVAAAPGTTLHRLRERTTFHYDGRKLLKDMINGVYAVIFHHHLTSYYVHQFPKQTACPVYVAREAVISGLTLSLSFPKKSPYRERVNRIIEGLQESGILQVLYDRTVPYWSACMAQESRQVQKASRPLELRDFYGVFCVYSGGVFIAAMAFIYEVACSSKTY